MDERGWERSWDALLDDDIEAASLDPSFSSLPDDAFPIFSKEDSGSDEDGLDRVCEHVSGMDTSVMDASAKGMNRGKKERQRERGEKTDLIQSTESDKGREKEPG